MRVVVDAGPLVSAAHIDDEAHALAAALLHDIGRDLLVPDPVAVEVDWNLRRRRGNAAARRFLRSLRSGALRRVVLSETLFRRALDIDEAYADLGLGLADAAVMAVAEAERCPILTFDFADFRATTAGDGKPWKLLVSEADYQRAVRPR